MARQTTINGSQHIKNIKRIVKHWDSSPRSYPIATDAMIRAEGHARFYADETRLRLHDATLGPDNYKDLADWRRSEADRIYELMRLLNEDWKQLIGLGVGALKTKEEIFKLNDTPVKA